MRSWWTARRVVIVVLVVALAAGVAGWQWLTDERPQVAAGEVLVAPSEGRVAVEETVRVPGADLRVRIGEPRDELGTGEVQVRAPGDGAFVWVEIEPVNAVQRALDRTAPAAVPAVEVVAGDQAIALPDLLSNVFFDGGSVVLMPVARWVAVAERDADVRVRFTVGGETQSVGADGVDAGRFAELEPLARIGGVVRTNSVDCRMRLPAGVTLEGPEAKPCLLHDVQRTPFLADRGWAPAGSEWLVVPQQPTVPYGLRDGEFTLSPRTDAEDRLTVLVDAGGQVERLRLASTGAGYLAEWEPLVVAVPTETAVAARWQLRTQALRFKAGESAERVPFQMRWTAEISP